MVFMEKCIRPDLMQMPMEIFLFKIRRKREEAFFKHMQMQIQTGLIFFFEIHLHRNIHLSISSGTDKSQSFFSTSFYHDDGWTIADNVKRYTLNFRNNYTFQ